jgi:transposase
LDGGLAAANYRVWEVILVNKSKAYCASDVNKVDVSKLMLGRQGQRAWIGMDIGKFEALAVLRWSDGRFERPWRVKNPEQLGEFLRVVKELSAAVKSAGGELLGVGLEPSGTYGDALRQALSDGGVPARRVSPKAAHDYAEVFDGVPSQHDGKDAAVVAELCAIGKSDPWPYVVPDGVEQEVGYWVDCLDAQRRLAQIWCGRLEGRVARHWPEVTRLLPISGATLLKTLAKFGGPGALAADPNAAGKLTRFCGRRLTDEKIQQVIASAKSSMGVRPTAWEQRRLKELAEHALETRKQMGQARRQLHRVTKDHASIRAMATVVGLPTACVLWVCCGNPGAYTCANAYSKALGLNLAERSSGTFKGKLKISKRGKAMSRRWLFFAAMRWVNDPRVRPWYERKKAKDGTGMRAVVAVMRKLSKALYQVGGKGATFDAARLFPGATAKKKAGAQSAQPKAATA